MAAKMALSTQMVRKRDEQRGLKKHQWASAPYTSALSDAGPSCLSSIHSPRKHIPLPSLLAIRPSPYTRSTRTFVLINPQIVPLPYPSNSSAHGLDFTHVVTRTYEGLEYTYHMASSPFHSLPSPVPIRRDMINTYSPSAFSLPVGRV
jgi:hypothetical protein